MAASAVGAKLYLPGGASPDFVSSWPPPAAVFALGSEAWWRLLKVKRPIRLFFTRCMGRATLNDSPTDQQSPSLHSGEAKWESQKERAWDNSSRRWVDRKIDHFLIYQY